MGCKIEEGFAPCRARRGQKIADRFQKEFLDYAGSLVKESYIMSYGFKLIRSKDSSGKPLRAIKMYAFFPGPSLEIAKYYEY